MHILSLIMNFQALMSIISPGNEYSCKNYCLFVVLGFVPGREQYEAE